MNRVSIAMIAGFAAIMIIMPVDSEAGRRSSTASTSKQPQRTQQTARQTKKQQKQAIRQQRQKVDRLTKEMNGMAQMVLRMRSRVGVDLASMPRERAVLNRKINEHGAAKAELNALKKQSYRQFAASRNIDVVPDPPSTPPPPLPSNTLAAPGTSNAATPGIKQSRTQRPAGGETPVVPRPGI